MQAKLQYAIDCARRHQIRVVIVVPEAVLSEARSKFAIIAANQGIFDGQTLILESGPKVSVISGYHPPKEKPFDAIFLGWGSKGTTNEGVSSWMKAAHQTI